MNMPTLETERLLLRPISTNDTNAIFDCWMKDENISRYMHWKASDNIEDTKKFVEFEITNIDNAKWNRWIIETKDYSTIVGTCLIFYNDEESSWDISYNLGNKYWGKGYITEAMKSVMSYAVSTLKIKECIAVHAVENPASGNVIKKLGFIYEKDVPYECNGGKTITTGKYYRYKVTHNI